MLFSVYSLVDHIPEGTPVSVQTSSVLGVWLAKGQKVIRCVDPGGQTMVVYPTEETSCSLVGLVAEYVHWSSATIVPHIGVSSKVTDKLLYCIVIPRLSR